MQYTDIFKLILVDFKYSFWYKRFFGLIKENRSPSYIRIHYFLLLWLTTCYEYRHTTVPLITLRPVICLILCLTSGRQGDYCRHTARGSWVQFQARSCGVCMLSLCLRGFPSGYSGFLPPSKDKHPVSMLGLIADSELPKGVNVIVYLYVNPVTNRQLVLGAPCLHPVSAGIGSSPQLLVG